MKEESPRLQREPDILRRKDNSLVCEKCRKHLRKQLSHRVRRMSFFENDVAHRKIGGINWRIMQISERKMNDSARKVAVVF